MRGSRAPGVYWGKVLDLEQLELRLRYGQRAKMRAQFTVRNQHIHPGVPKDEIHLVRLEKIVDGHGHPADSQNSQQRRHKLGTVLQPDPDPVAGFDAVLSGQLARDGERLVQEGGVGEFAFAPEQGGFLGPFPG